MSAQRPTTGSATCSPLAPMQIGGTTSGRGVAAASSIVKYSPWNVGCGSVHISRQICDHFLELVQSHRCRRELVAVRVVLVLAPPTTDAEHEPSAGEHLQRRRHLGDQRRVAIAVPEHVMAQHHVGELGGQPRERRPALEEAFRLLLVESVEVVGDPHRVEVRQRGGEDVALLVHHDRLEVASRVTGDRRQPSELHHGAILAWRLRVPHISVTVRRVRGRFGSMCVLACVGMLAAGCGGGDDDTASTDPAAPTSASAPATTVATVASTSASTSTSTSVAVATTQPLPTEGLIAEIEVLGGPDWLAVDEHGVWAKHDNGSVVLIDPATNAIVDTVDVDVGGELCQGLGAGDGSIWACSGPDVARIDASFPEVLSVLPVGKTYTQGEPRRGRGPGLDADRRRLDAARLPHGHAGPLVTVRAAGAGHRSRCRRGRTVGHQHRRRRRRSTSTWIPVACSTGSTCTAPVDITVDSDVWIGAQTESVRVDVSSGAIDLRVPVGTGDDGSIATTPGEVWIRNVEPLHDARRSRDRRRDRHVHRPR